MKNLKLTIMYSKIKIIFGQLLKRLVLILSKKGTTLASTFTSESLNLNKINISLWFEVLETGNIGFISGCTPEIFEKLYDDFFTKLDNKEAKAHLDKNLSKYKLAFKTDLVIKCYENLKTIYNHASNLENPIELEQKIISTINLLHPKAKITGSIENKLFIVEQLIQINKNDFERIEIKEKTEKSFNFMEQVVNIELALNFKIDTENTSVEKYIYYVKQAQLKSKALENGRS